MCILHSIIFLLPILCLVFVCALSCNSIFFIQPFQVFWVASLTVLLLVCLSGYICWQLDFLFDLFNCFNNFDSISNLYTIFDYIYSLVWLSVCLLIWWLLLLAWVNIKVMTTRRKMWRIFYSMLSNY